MRRIRYAYDRQGNPYLFTSYDAASGGNIVNQVEDVYNGLGQLTAEYQSPQRRGEHRDHARRCSTPTRRWPAAQNNSRLTSMTYPNGYVTRLQLRQRPGQQHQPPVVDLGQPGDAGGYTYLGLDTVVERDHPQTGVNLTYIKQTGDSTGDAGDQYTGLDRFGRVVDQNWYNTQHAARPRTTSSTATTATATCCTRTTCVDAVFSELYHATPQRLRHQSDQLRARHAEQHGRHDRQSVAQPELGLDALGNFTSVTTNGTPQTRTPTSRTRSPASRQRAR